MITTFAFPPFASDFAAAAQILVPWMGLSMAIAMLMNIGIFSQMQLTPSAPLADPMLSGLPLTLPVFSVVFHGSITVSSTQKVILPRCLRAPS
jgi:hypothetical protein